MVRRNGHAGLRVAGGAVDLLGMAGVGVAAGQAPRTVDAPQVLPAEVVAAWEKGGARFGWMGLNRQGSWYFIGQREAPEARAVPAFRIETWRAGMVEKLPVPMQAFG